MIWIKCMLLYNIFFLFLKVHFVKLSLCCE